MAPGALALLAALLMMGAQAAPLALADTRVVSSTVENQYPASLVFKLEATADSQITDVSLLIRVTGEGSAALVKPRDFVAGTSVSTRATVEANSGSSYLPVGSEVTYHWEITTADGQTLMSPGATFVFLPPAQQWQSVSNDIMTVYYFGNRQAVAETYLAAGLDTYKKIGQGLLNATLKDLPVRVVMFANEAQLEEAKPGGGTGRFEEAVLTCGTQVSNTVVLLIPQACGSTDRTDTLRHEFTHILTKVAGEGPVGKLPAWLDEGTAVYSQADPGENYTGAVVTAARVDRLIPFNQMGTPAGDSRLVNLFYGQSYEMVRFLIETGGTEKYAGFFAAIKKGMRFDQALAAVYGFDLAKFEADFLKSMDAAPSAAPTTAPTTPAQQTRPTAVPTKRAQTAAKASSSDNDDSSNLVVIGAVAVAAVFALVAVFLFLMTRMMAANRRREVAPPRTEGEDPPSGGGA